MERFLWVRRYWAAGLAVLLLGMVGSLFFCFKKRNPAPSENLPPKILAQAYEGGVETTIPGEVMQLVDWNGVLWMAAQKGLYRCLPDGVVQKAEIRGLEEGPVSSAIVLPGKPVFCLAVRNEIIRIDSEQSGAQKTARLPYDITALAAGYSGGKTRFFAATGSGIYETDNSTLNAWTRCAGPGGTVTKIVSGQADSGIFYAATMGEGIWRFSEQESVWHKMPGFYPNRISGEETGFSAEIDSENPVAESDLSPEFQDLYSGGIAVNSVTGLLYLGTVRGVLIWNPKDGRTDWLPAAGIGTPIIQDILFDPRPGAGLLALTARGIYRYDQQAVSWEWLWKSSGESHLEKMFLDPLGGGFWVGTADGIIRSPIKLPAGPASGEFSEPAPFHLGKKEPSIQALQRRVMEYSEVAPEKIARWRQQARWRALIPTFNLSMDRDWDSNVTSSSSSGVSHFFVGPVEQNSGVGFSFNWDLGDFIWSTDQTSIDVRSRLMVQLRQDLLEETTRLYFERQKLMAEFDAHPSTDPFLNRERLIRIQELTAYLDGISGGWFSREMEAEPMEFG